MTGIQHTKSQLRWSHLGGVDVAFLHSMRNFSWSFHMFVWNYTSSYLQASGWTQWWRHRICEPQRSECASGWELDEGFFAGSCRWVECFLAAVHVMSFQLFFLIYILYIYIFFFFKKRYTHQFLLLKISFLGYIMKSLGVWARSLERMRIAICKRHWKRIVWIWKANSVRVSMSDVMFLILVFFSSDLWVALVFSAVGSKSYNKMPPGRIASVFVESVLCFSWNRFVASFQCNLRIT